MTAPWERYGGASVAAADDAGPWARYSGHSAESQVAAAAKPPSSLADNENYWRSYTAEHSGNAELTAPVRTPWQRFKDAASNAAHEIQAPVLNYLGTGILSRDASNLPARATVRSALAVRAARRPTWPRRPRRLCAISFTPSRPTRSPCMASTWTRWRT
jgi:hypothetical protein